MKTTFGAAVAALVLAGCAGFEIPPVVGVPVIPEPPPLDALVPDAAVVAAGLTFVDKSKYGGWDGACLGADVDVETVAGYGRDNRFLTTVKFNDTATTFRVMRAILESAAVLPEDGLLVVYYSGHGGQVPDADGDEADGMDETLCLWDAQLVDDLIYQCLKSIWKPVNVVFITDCCNAGTNWRNALDIPKAMQARASRDRAGELRCNILHIGGCADGESSYGGVEGGAATIALFKTVTPEGKTWREWFEAAQAVMPRNQRLTFSEYGDSFADAPAMRRPPPEFWMKRDAVRAACAATLHVYGDAKNCSQTRKLRAITDAPAFKDKLAAAGMCYAVVDPSVDAAAYKAFKTKYNREGGLWPKIMVVDAAGKLLWKTVARSSYITPYTADGIVAAAKAACPQCGDPVTPPPTPAGKCAGCGGAVPVTTCAGCGRVTN